MSTVDSVSKASRIAEPGEGISEEELRLAGRNHAMPLEALHYDVTPAGMHYLLTTTTFRQSSPTPTLSWSTGWSSVRWCCASTTSGLGRAGPSTSRSSAPATVARCSSRVR